MTQRLYLIPINHISIGDQGDIYHTPKYLPHRLDPALAGLEEVRFTWEIFWLGHTAIVVADTDDTQNGLLIAQTDVVAVPPLDSTIAAGVLPVVQSVLETGGIPGNWVQVGMSYRQVLRIILGIMQFHKRFMALSGRRAGDGPVALTLRVNQIPQATRTILQNVATEFGLDFSAVTGTTAVRQLLIGMGQQFASRSFTISGAGLAMEI